MSSSMSGKPLDLGILLLRLGYGLMFMFHGYPKLLGGPEMWGKVGGAMAIFGVDFAPEVWGLLAALAEFGGGICLMLGIFFRPACMAMLFTMIVATSMHITKGDNFGVFSHALEAAIVFLSLLVAGAGEYKILKGK